MLSQTRVDPRVALTVIDGQSIIVYRQTGNSGPKSGGETQDGKKRTDIKDNTNRTETQGGDRGQKRRMQILAGDARQKARNTNANATQKYRSVANV
jgi:hypothetical protein